MVRIFNKIASFNTEKTVIFLSEYDHFVRESTGLSTYSRLTLDELQDKFKTEFDKTVVLSIGKIINEPIRIVQEGRRCIIPCIRKNNPFSLLKSLKYFFALTQVKDIVIEFEFASYGGPLSVLTLIILLGILKAAGKRVYFVMHQAVNDLNGLHEHLGLSKNSNKFFFLNYALIFFYRLIGMLSSKIVVLEQEIKDRISTYIDEKKIIFIPLAPLAVSSISAIRKNKQKSHKGRINILIFGYIAWYKGLDRFIKAFNKINDTNTYLTIAGGYSPTQRGKSHYEAHYKSVLESAKKNPRIVITGYVPENRLASYYHNADICLFPYKAFLSSSGPLSRAFGYSKPVVLSKELTPYMKSKDFKDAMDESFVKEGDIFYSITPKSLQLLINRIKHERNYSKKLMRFSHNMNIRRSWQRVVIEYKNMIVNMRNFQKLSSSQGEYQPHTIYKSYRYS